MGAKDFKMLTRENIPCWYDLFWQVNPPTIGIRIHKDFIRDTEPVSDNDPIVKHFKHEFSFSSFIGDFDKGFGFNNVFIRDKQADEFVDFLVKIPIIKKPTGKSCDHCNGSGEDSLLHHECLWCNGKGKEYFYDWDLAYLISASFTVFFNLLEFLKEETSASILQLLVVRTMTQRDAHGGSLSGMFSIPLCKWLGNIFQAKDTSIPEMISAMQVTYGYMSGELKEYEKHDFRAYAHDWKGWLNVSCPGNACGLHPLRGTEVDRGYNFSCHNVDSPIQQITLLAGLAALNDRTRREKIDLYEFI